MKKKLRFLLLSLSIVYLVFKIIKYIDNYVHPLPMDFVLGLFVAGSLVFACIALIRRLFGGGTDGR